MSSLKERLERLKAAAKSAEQEARNEAAQSEEACDIGDGASGVRNVNVALEAGHASGDSGDKCSANHGSEGAAVLHPDFSDFGIEQVENEYGTFLLRRLEYRFPFRHGHYGLEQLADCAERLAPLARRQNKKNLKIGDPEVAVEPQGLLFLDTETTGLGVGAGNVPFMIGMGTYTECSFIVEQTLIRHPGEERAMLAFLAEKLKSRTHIASYNGKTFDWPLIEGRFIMNGWRPTGAGPGHLDFLHPARAIWRSTLPSCKLSVVEGARLGLAREEDVPGSMAPELYIRFLGDNDPRHLYGVFEHNEKDVLSLAALAIHFGHLLGGRLGSEAAWPEETEELYRVALWLESLGREAEAERLFGSLAERRWEEGSASFVWRMALAVRFKRAGALDRAIELWEEAARLAEKSRIPSWEAHVELAKHYEHRIKDFRIALFNAESALEIAHRRYSLMRETEAVRLIKTRLLHRCDRLRKRLERLREANETAEGVAHSSGRDMNLCE
ncbi:ribonuclease H-like domain-containing protein [Cohnella faecalis]|uniref:YprB ribonuclease H-like domain-containing protein n=1 Tax=Cohnella faecalis TaxID=2315694 RepID=A0A398CQF3_9BACL|nr:ribonuclease H-like domain-containing protein [Cohnella faecalis]RIE04775.1 hypothetical protein D3H35_04675 [Cohnella faecalis]